MPFRFGSPALLLLVPAAVFMVILVMRRSLAGLPPVRRWASFALRVLLVLALAAALAEVQSVKTGKGLSVFFVVDRSASMPVETRGRIAAYVNKAAEQAGKDDLAGLIFFGRDAAIEKMPDHVTEPSTFFTESAAGLDRERTNLSAAVRLALAAFPEGTRKRIVLISDGRENEGLALEQADAARSIGCPIDVFPVDYQHTAEVLIEKAVAPARLRVGEPFELRVVINATQPTTAQIDLVINGTPIATGRTAELPGGKEVISFPLPDGLPQPGPHTFDVAIRCPPGTDTIIENNKASAFSWVEGKAREVLVVDRSPDDLSYLLAALKEEDIAARVITPGQMPGSIGELRRYDCLVLGNAAAHRFAGEHLGMIEAAVKELGMGLVLIGGEESFGPGGYRNTPIEACSPVDFDIRHKRVMPKGAIVLAMDAAEDPSGNRWAIEMARASVNVLSWHDELGIVQSGGWHLPLTEIGDKKAVLTSIDKLQVPDGNDFETFLRQARDALMKSNAAAKHVLIMTDGGHGQYVPSPALRTALQEARITVSTALFHPHEETENAVVTSFTRLSYENGGRFYYPRTANELPRIFFKEATMITRSLIWEDAAGFPPAMRQLTDPVRGFGDGFPPLTGYVLTTPKPRAQVPIVRNYHDPKLDEDVNDPILAHWICGLGKVVAFTSDAKNRWAANWVGWSGYRKFWPQVVRWTFPASAVGSATVRSNVDVRDGKAKVTVDVLDASGLPVNFLQLSGSALSPHADATGRLDSFTLEPSQTGPGRYEAEFDAVDAGAWFVSFSYSGADPQGKEISGIHTTGTVVPYSPEYRDLTANASLLKKLAENSGGRLLDATSNVFERTMPPARSSQPVWPILLLIAVAAFPADVAVRKIMIDWRRVAAVIIAQFAFLRRTRPQTAESPATDPAMGRLLSRKQKAQQSLTPEQIIALQEKLEQQSASPPGLAAPGEQPAAPTVEKPAPPPAEPQQPETNIYTQRLIQAKKRARKKDEGMNDER